MLNSEIFLRNPTENPIPNNGVATVADAKTESQQNTLRYELTNFICQGQYDQGLCRILRSYISTLEHGGEQKGVWVSGFYGSGKSHLVKILQYLWTDQTLSDGTSARSMASNLTDEVKHMLKELSTCAVRYGGLHAAAGTLGSQTSQDVPLAVLQIVLSSLNIPEQLASAELYLHLQEEGTLQDVAAYLQAQERTLHHELENLYVSAPLREALAAISPSFKLENKEITAAIRAQFPPGRMSISVNEMVKIMQRAISINGQLPLTLLILDELQQFIGDSLDKSYKVQEIAEACATQFSSKLLLVATGQSAITNTGSLERLAARFPIQISLSDTDVEAVTRAIVLMKKPDKFDDVKRLIDQCSGEIYQQMQGTVIAPNSQDGPTLVQDYPILPSRRRFWERVLRAVDSTGTSSMLRAQLRIVQEAVAGVAEKELGHVVAADALYNQISEGMQQSGALLYEERNVIEKHKKEANTNAELKGRLCALIFLISKLERDGNAENSIRATPSVLADLLVEDLRAGGGELRRIVPEVLQELAESNDLMFVDGAYRIQTRESSEWSRDLNDRKRKLMNDYTRIGERRTELLKMALEEVVSKVRVLQGEAKEVRKVALHLTPACPTSEGNSIVIWARDGWSVTERIVQQDASEAGIDNPVVQLFIPANTEVLDQKIATLEAANETLNSRATPTTPDGKSARTAVQQQAGALKDDINVIVREVLGEGTVYQGGGTQVEGSTIHERLQIASDAAATRLFPKFKSADNSSWHKVIERVREGNAKPMEAIGEQGEAAKNSVAHTILEFVGPGKKGSAIRQHFAQPPYGWPKDAVDGSLMALVVEAAVLAKRNGNILGIKEIDQKIIGDCEFHVEKFQLSRQQLIKLRGLFLQLDMKCNQGEEAVYGPQFVKQIKTCAESAGGEPPAPEISIPLYIEELKHLTGTELLNEIYNHLDDFTRDIPQWKQTSVFIEKRRRNWQILQELLSAARGLAGLSEFEAQSNAIRAGRLLLQDPDPMIPLQHKLEEELRTSIRSIQKCAQQVYDEEMKQIDESDMWAKLTDSEWKQILDEANIKMPHQDAVDTVQQILDSLDARNLDAWKSEVDALTERFARARKMATQRLEPNCVQVILPRQVLKTVEEVDEYLDKVREMIMTKIQQQPVQVA